MLCEEERGRGEKGRRVLERRRGKLMMNVKRKRMREKEERGEGNREGECYYAKGEEGYRKEEKRNVTKYKRRTSVESSQVSDEEFPEPSLHSSPANHQRSTTLLSCSHSTSRHSTVPRSSGRSTEFRGGDSSFPRCSFLLPCDGDGWRTRRRTFESEFGCLRVGRWWRRWWWRWWGGGR